MTTNPTTESEGDGNEGCAVPPGTPEACHQAAECESFGGTYYPEYEGCLIEPSSSDTTTTTRFPCPDPNAPFCGLDVNPTPTTLVAHPAPITTLPHTGPTDGLALLGAVLVAIGVTLVRSSKTTTSKENT